MPIPKKDSIGIWKGNGEKNKGTQEAVAKYEFGSKMALTETILDGFSIRRDHFRFLSIFLHPEIAVVPFWEKLGKNCKMQKTNVLAI